MDLDDPKLVTAHNHDPSVTKVAVVKCRSEMKQQAKQSFDKPSQIMTQAMSQIDVVARVDRGREESIKRTLRNQRLGRIPPQPESLQDLVIDGEWALTTGPDPQGSSYLVPVTLCNTYLEPTPGSWMGTMLLPLLGSASCM